MSAFTSLRRAGVVAAAIALAACSDSTDPGEHPEPEVASMVVTIEGQEYVAGASGFTGGADVTTGPVAVSAEFLNDEGEPDPVVAEHADEYQLSVAGNANGGALPAGVTFTRTGSFTGNLTVPAGETVTIFFGLFHVEEEHDDFGPFPLQITRP